MRRGVPRSTARGWLTSTGTNVVTLDTVRTVAKLVAFYVDEHNMRLPHSAFRGQTPDEMYFGTGSPIPDELEAARTAARQSRMAVNRTTSCPTCERFVSIAN